MQIAPEAPLGFRNAGRINRTSGELAEAVEWYRQSLAIAPEDRNSKVELGALLVDLGLYDEAEGLLGDQRYIAHLAVGDVEKALPIVRASLAKRPEHLGTIFAAARAETRAGNFDQVRSLLEPLAVASETGKGPLFTGSGIHFWDPQIAAMNLVVARMETRDEQAALALLSQVRKYFAFLKSEGLDYPMLSYQEAKVLALEGKSDEALEVLRQMIAAGWRFWYLHGDPALKSLQEGSGFRALLNQRDTLVEQEVAKL